jgi:hypothetical protein
MNNLPASTGWDWLKQGVGLFRKQPAALTTLLFATVLFSLLLGLVPLFGPLLGPVLVPSLSMAVMQACLMIENGQRVTLSVLLTGFRKPALAALCKVGLVYLGVWIVEMVVVALTLGPEFFQKVVESRQMAKDEAQLMAAAPVFMTFFCIMMLNLVIMITLYFAGPLTYWKQMSTGKALFYSFFAVVRTARVFLVLLLAWFGLFFVLVWIAQLLFRDFWIGQVVVMWVVFLFVLLLQCAMYAGYRTIFGKPAEGSEPGFSSKGL